jgi:FkbM family methyltransferase
MSKLLWFFYHFKKPYIKTGTFWIKYLVDTRSALDSHIIKYGILNDFVAVNLNKFIEKNSVVFDIWSNVWLLSLPFAKEHLPEWKVFSYEPDKENYSKFLKNIELNTQNNIYPNEITLQNNQSLKELSFFIRRATDWDWNNNLWLSSLWNPGLHTKEEIIVKASTVDNEVKRYCLERLDFIKIDVEWFECEVLEGAQRSITEYQPIIQYEFSPILDTLLKKNNYIQYRIINERYLELFDTFKNDVNDCNIICFPPDKTPKTIDNFIKQTLWKIHI